MILYRGTIHENTRQPALLKSLGDDCFRTLDRAEPLEPGVVIDACDRLTQHVREGRFEHLVRPLLLELDIPEATFSEYVSTFSKASLERKMQIELGGDHTALDPLDDDHERALRPLGILFHIAAGNLDVLPAYSVMEGLLAGNINILKLPTGDKGVSVELLRALIEIEPRLKDYIYVFDVPSVETDTLALFAELADAIVVWGGDEAVKAARAMAKPDTRLIEWGHKLSFAYASPEASDSDLRALARNISSTNQLLCSSAQGIFVDTTSRDALDRFAERFFTLLLDVQKDHQAVPFGMKGKNAVELYYEELVKDRTGRRIWKKDGISVVTSDDSSLETSLLFRNVWVKRLPKERIVETIKPHKNHLQTASILASGPSYETYQDKLIRGGVVRVRRPGDMSESVLGESHDGMYPLRLYTKIVETCKKS